MNELRTLKCDLITEQRDLSLKVEKLYAFLHSNSVENLDKEGLYLLVEQYGYMKNYLRIMNKRIALINEQIKNIKK